MTPFLKQVAEYYYGMGGIDRKCFVFPNRRSMAFFARHLGDAVVNAGEDAAPLLVPQMLTINDFFFKVSGKRPSDRVRLLLSLYDCYRKLNPKAETDEPLDDFIFWGDMILADFNDIDKYLVDPSQIFTNIAELKNLQDTFEYLTDNQRKAIERFVSHFRDSSGQLTVDPDAAKPDVKERFLHVWNILNDLYRDFNDLLKSQGTAYEGMVYRELAERVGQAPVADVLGEHFAGVGCFVFVGLNALNECEKTLLRRLRDARMAEFCWDYSGDMIRDPQNRSSVFMSGNVVEFPRAFSLDEDVTGVPEINVVSVSSAVGQAKRLPDILSGMGGEPTDCAVVLPDENLLIPVLNSIPEAIEDINVTMGLPMRGSLMYSFMASVSSVQLHALSRGGEWNFYHRQVWELFSSPLFKAAADERTLEIVGKVRKEAKYYIPGSDLSGTPVLDVIFRAVVTDSRLRSEEQIRSLAAYQKEVIEVVVRSISENKEFAVEAEYAMEYYRAVSRLQEIPLEVLPVTYIRLLDRLLSTVSVPFKGEPLKGLQVMGPLEMRALDFRNLVILSVNEGTFPRRRVSSSFIPPELRKGFGLPTYEYQDAVWAYYFYRMIRRAEKVWLLTDSRTEGMKFGEESRYIKQLEYHFGLPLNRYVVKFGKMTTASVPEIVKTVEDVEKIRQTALSATSIKSYLVCPAKFYYSVVKELVAETEVAESLDAGMLGNVFHETMRSVYTSEEAMAEDFWFDPQGCNERGLKQKISVVGRDYIESWLGREDDIRRKVKSLIVRQLNCVEVTGRNLVVADVILRYVAMTLRQDLKLMERHGVTSFRILGREMRLKGSFEGQKIKGIIDRLDSFGEGTVRVVDYKTGKVLKDDEYINDENAEDIATRIFAPDVKERPEIAFQFFVYDMLLEQDGRFAGCDVFNSVYSTASLFEREPEEVRKNDMFYSEVTSRLSDLLRQMCDVSVPFRRTQEKSSCEYCDFRTICGR